MLDRNYADWRGYLNRLLSADFKEHVDVSEELNRLLLNYLALAYAIQEHFSVRIASAAEEKSRKAATILGVHRPSLR